MTISLGNYVSVNYKNLTLILVTRKSYEIYLPFHPILVVSSLTIIKQCYLVKVQLIVSGIPL